MRLICDDVKAISTKNKKSIPRDELNACYEAVMTQLEIGKLYGCSARTVRRITKEYGITVSRVHYNIGDRYGRRTIVATANPNSRGQTRVVVRCDCGKEDVVYLANLIRRRADMCRSCSSKSTYSIGDRFGKRTIIGDAEPQGTRHSTMVKVRCDCGSEDIVSLAQLRCGKSIMCKACQLKYAVSKRNNIGATSNSWYNIWGGMIQRCTNPNNPNYPRYGGRGIKICDEWLDSSAFGDWAIANGYVDGLTIDRIDNDGNYEPENCRWTDMLVQQNNRSDNVFVTVNGDTDTLANICRKYNLKYNNILQYKRCHNLSYEDVIYRYLSKGEI